MSRTPKSKGLKSLCATRGLQIADLACMSQTSRQKIRVYSIGERHFPILEAKLANIFNLSVPQLRKKLGLPVMKLKTLKRLKRHLLKVAQRQERAVILNPGETCDEAIARLSRDSLLLEFPRKVMPDASWLQPSDKQKTPASDFQHSQVSQKPKLLLNHKSSKALLSHISTSVRHRDQSRENLTQYKSNLSRRVQQAGTDVPRTRSRRSQVQKTLKVQKNKKSQSFGQSKVSRNNLQPKIKQPRRNNACAANPQERRKDN